MTRIQVARMAWAGAIGAAAAAWIYLTAMPMTGSLLLDNVAAIAIVLIGAVGAALLERRLDMTVRTAMGAAQTTHDRAADPERIPIRS